MRDHHRGRHGPFGGGPPPWLRQRPDGEGTPGPSPEQWAVMRRRFVGGAVLLVAVVVTMVVSLGAVLGRLVLSGDGGRPSTLAGVGLLVVLVALAARLTFRWARPVHGVMEAADRVADGDLTARAPDGGPRAVRRLARSFNTMADRLQADDDRRRQLLADIAHELRTPMSVVRGNVEGLVDGIYEPDPARLGHLLAQVDQVERLLRDLRTLSNADAGVLDLELEDVSLAAVAARVAASFGTGPETVGVRLDVVVDDDLPLVTGDPGRLEQVLSNLVDNALRHARRRVELAVRRGDGAVVCTVADDGEGMPPEQVVDVFERFAGSTHADGTGLGLPIVRRLVVRHGGTVELSSEPGVGTSVVVRLPV